MNPEIGAGAHFSPDKKYRFALWRIWDLDKPLVMLIGLNPSIASEMANDRTISRLVGKKGFVSRHGYGGFYMMNLFPYVSSHPEDLKKYNQYEKELQANDQWLQEVNIHCETVIFCLPKCTCGYSNTCPGGDKCQSSTPSKDLLKDGEKGITVALEFFENWVYATWHPEDSPERIAQLRQEGYVIKKMSVAEFKQLPQNFVGPPVLSNGEKVYRWVKASERLPDPAEHWLANAQDQEGVIVFCKVLSDYGPRKGTGYFFRSKNLLNFSYSYKHDAEGYWSDENNGYVAMSDFDTIEWLQEIPAPLNQPDREDDCSEEYEKWLNQPGIGREENGEDEFHCPDCGQPWDTKAHNSCQCGAILSFPNKDSTGFSPLPSIKTVSAVNAPAEALVSKKSLHTEIPEETEQWIGQEFKKPENGLYNFDQFREGAIAMYSKLQERPEGMETPDETTQRKLAEWYLKQLRECQASLSSIKGEKTDLEYILAKERQRHHDEQKQFKLDRAALTADRDLYRKESEALRAALELANNDRAGKNVRIAEMEEALAKLLNYSDGLTHGFLLSKGLK